MVRASLVFWDSHDVARWMTHLGMDDMLLNKLRDERVTGAKLVSLVNQHKLSDIVSAVQASEIVWSIERRIRYGDDLLGKAVDPAVFTGVSSRLSASRRSSSARSMFDPASGEYGQPPPKPAPPAMADLLDLSDEAPVAAAAAAAVGTAGGPSAAPAAPTPLLPPPPPAPAANGAGANAGATAAAAAAAASHNSAANKKREVFSLIDLGDESAPQDVSSAEDASATAAPTAAASVEVEDDGGIEDDFLSVVPPAPGLVAAAKSGAPPPAPLTSEAAAAAASNGPPPEAIRFEVTFTAGNTPNVLLEEFQPGNRLVVKGFPKRRDGSAGAAELSKRIERGDLLEAANYINLEGFPFRDAIELLMAQPYPLTLRFRRVPKHLRAHTFERWSVNALRSVLLEQGVELTGLEPHAQLVVMAKRTFWDRPVPLPPAPPRVELGAAAVANGETSIMGWLLVCGPGETAFRRLFCDLHGSELLFHRPLAAPTAAAAAGTAATNGGSASGGGSSSDVAPEYEAAPSGSVDMATISLVATTRSSEEGQKDLRMVAEDGGVWQMSAAREDALAKWLRQLTIAQIVGPNTRTSSGAEPSAPILAGKTHNSLTVSWLPPRLPHLNSVVAFQVQYRQGITPFSPWRTAEDEVHSTRVTIKGLPSGEKFQVRVRAHHEASRAGMVWGEWSEVSDAFSTDKTVYRAARPPQHLWVLVHGVRGDPSDMGFMAEQLRARFGGDAHIFVSSTNGGPLATLEGIPKAGTRLFEEVMGEIEGGRSLRYISFICHGAGALFARYALRLLDDRGILAARIEGLNFIAMGAPMMGTQLSFGGVMGKMFDMETSSQLRLADGRGGTTPQQRMADGRSSGAGGNQPLLLKMTAKEYCRALSRFARRVLYANVRHDTTVEYGSAALLLTNPFDGLFDRDLAALCSPHYNHVLKDSAAAEAPQLRANRGPGGAGGGVIARGRSVGGGAGPLPALAVASGDAPAWERALATLSDLGWQRVDIFNPTSSRRHSDLVVASPWLGLGGSDIVRHVLDEALNRPPGAVASPDGGRGGGGGGSGR